MGSTDIAVGEFGPEQCECALQPAAGAGDVEQPGEERVACGAGGGEDCAGSEVCDMQAAADAAQAATEAPAQEAAVDASEDISMEEVLGPGTHKKPVANEDAEQPKVESQTV